MVVSESGYAHSNIGSTQVISRRNLMKTLPSHTTRYWAEQFFKLSWTRGIRGSRTYPTVQGVLVTCSLGHDHKYIKVAYEIDGSPVVKIERVQQQWKGF